MILVCYRRDGKVCRYHSVPESVPGDQLSDKVREYNERSQDDHAFLEYVSEEGLTAYLLKRLEEKSDNFRDTVNDLRKLLSEASYLVEDLEL